MYQHLHRNRKIAVLLVPILALYMAGCPQSAYHSAVVAEHDFSAALQAFQQAEMAEHTNGRIDQAEHQRLEAGIEKVALGALALVDSLQKGASNTTVQQNFTSISNLLNALVVDGVFGVKNPQSQNLLSTLIKTIQAILQNVGSLLSVQQTVPITKAGG